MSTAILRVEMLPAEEGDALWIEYGPRTAPRRMLIDGGVFATAEVLVEKLAAIEGPRRFELVVVTHIDNDHIDGLVRLLGRDHAMLVDDVWFNGWAQIQPEVLDDRLGAKQGELLSERIRVRGFPHNRQFDGGPIGVPTDPDRPLPVRDLPGGMRLTVLGPTRRDLDRLRDEWHKTIVTAGLEPGGEFTAAKIVEQQPKYHSDRLGGGRPPNVRRWADRTFTDDTTVPNGSSIALLAEYGDRRILFAGDSHADTLIDGIDRLLRERGIDRLRLDAFKLPHHGSKNNLSNALMDRLDCDVFLVSTSGNRFDHPDDDAIARVIADADEPEIVFNYRSDENRKWDRADWKRELHYRTTYPPDGTDGVAVEFDVGVRAGGPT